MYEILVNNITDIEDGIIIHQVNCKGVIGGGISGVITQKYKNVRKKYKQFIDKTENPFGQYQCVRVTRSLIVVNAFSQFDYGNAYKTHKQYTDYDKLVNIIKEVVEKYPNENVYIPYNIGCGLGGGKWSELEPMLKDIDVIVAKRYNERKV